MLFRSTRCLVPLFLLYSSVERLSVSLSSGHQDLLSSNNAVSELIEKTALLLPRDDSLAKMEKTGE